MNEQRDAWDELLDAGFLHALRDAHEAATRIVLDALSRDAGFKERSFGYTAYDVLESQLDRAFGLDGTAAATSSAEHPFRDVVRDNLNGSPGWRLGRYRVLLKRHEFGAVDAIRWEKASATKQAVSKQRYAEDPQLSLDLGEALGGRADTPGPVTLVLAHSATEAPVELELFLGRPRFNADGGLPWWWRSPLTRETLGPDPRLAAPATLPLWHDDDADGVPLRLRTNTKKHGLKHGLKHVTTEQTGVEAAQ